MPALAGLALLAGLSCGQDEVAVVEVPFRFGAGDCATAEVVRVRGAVYDFDGPSPAAEGVAACAAGRVEVPDVEAGTYSIVLEGLDAGGCVTHTARLDGVRVRPPSRTTTALRLGLAPRPLELTWRLGDAASCDSVGLRQVEALVQVGDAAPARAVFLCEAGRGRLPSVPAGPARIFVKGLDAEGTSIARGEAAYGEDMLRASACDPAIHVEVGLEGCASAGCP
jgi:hypothetical protein